MAIAPLNWRPTSYAQVVADIDSYEIRETQFLELKRMFDHGESGKGKFYKALASLANYGGTLVIGVEEEKALGRAREPQPVKLAGEVERVMQIAANLDPPLALPTPLELADPNDPTQGVVIVVVPASPMAPHRTPNGYFARDAKRAFPMPDAQLEQMIRLRRARTVEVEATLKQFVASVGSMMAPSAWFAIAVDPNPSHHPFLLRSRLNETARSWLDGHIAAADDRVRNLVVGDSAAAAVSLEWRPFNRHPHPGRIDGGVRFTSALASGTPGSNGGTRNVIEIMETGAVRVSENHVNYDGGTVIRWRELLGAAAWTVGLFQSIQQEAGPAVGASVAVHVGRIRGMTPDPNFGTPEQQRVRLRHGGTGNPYPAKEYYATRALSGVEVAGDLSDALDWLFGQMLRNFGLPDLLYRPPAP